MIRVKNLVKYYGNQRVLQKISFQAVKGELIGIIGINGAGKTTLFDILLGHIDYHSGEVYFKNLNIKDHPQTIRAIGSLLEPQFYSYLTVQENLFLLQEALGYKGKEVEENIEYWLNRYRLLDKRHEKVKHLSFGQRQRVGLIQAINHNAELLILDEPFVGLDPHGKDLLKEDLKKLSTEGVCILCSSHDLYDIGEIADRILYLEEGRILYDGAFHLHKSYSILVDGPMTSLPIEKRDGLLQVDYEKQQIRLFDQRLLSDVLTELIGHDLKIRQINENINSLYDFFRKEA